jgi:heat shock protein HtpX
MVTMTLVQGVVNAFVMFCARVLAWGASLFVDEEKRGIVNLVAVIVFEIMFSLLGMVVVAAFSRRREFRADQGGASLVGTPKMVAALKMLQRGVTLPATAPSSMAALQINSPKKNKFFALISTHPPLEDRILRLQQQAPLRA